MPKKRPLSSKPVAIGNNVWIGKGVSVMPDVVLRDKVLVGANAVITHSFPAKVVIVGCPAKAIKVLIDNESDSLSANRNERTIRGTSRTNTGTTTTS